MFACMYVLCEQSTSKFAKIYLNISLQRASSVFIMDMCASLLIKNNNIMHTNYNHNLTKLIFLISEV